MADLIIESSMDHLLQRAQQRFGHEKNEAKLIFEKVTKVITNQAPEDWRFTVSPSAKFIICYEPQKIDYRFVGRSYRDSNGIGIEIVKTLKSSSISAEFLGELVEKYKKLLFNPGCEIYHEIKTIYSHTQDLSEEKDIFEAIIKTKAVPHIVPIDAKRVARRPNAIIVDDEMWVRQGEYIDLSKQANGDYQENLIFERLTCQGIDKSKIHFYTFNKQGHLWFTQEEQRNTTFLRGVRKCQNLRSQSYWTLPTYIDAVYMDLDYARTHWRGDRDEQEGLKAEDMFLLAHIEILLKIAKESLR